MMQPQASLFSDPDHERRQAARMRGSRRVIKVAVGRAENPVPKYRERDAVVFGPLALMPTVRWDGWEARHEGWTITHVNTGYAVGPSIPKRPDALRAIYLLKDEDWSFRHRNHVPPGLREKALAVLRDAGARTDAREEHR